MYKYYSTYGVNWGEKSEDENLNPTPTNSNLLSQQFPQSTQGICRLNFKTAIASLTVQGDAIATLTTNKTKPTGPSCLGGFVVSENLSTH
jgi:hypothetical protein